jgi:MFS family permease
MGLGCLVWVPLSIGLGRRPTILIATMVVLIATLGAAQAQSFAQLVIATCFLGLSEGLGLCLVSDTFQQLCGLPLTIVGIPHGY